MIYSMISVSVTTRKKVFHNSLSLKHFELLCYLHSKRDIKNQQMNLNIGDKQKLHAAMHAGYQHRTKLTHDSQHALRHE